MGIIDERGQGGRPGDATGLRWCALCAAEYVPGVEVCVDCVVPLVDQPPLRADDIGDEEGEQLAYEFDDLAPADRLGLDRELAAAGVVHAWDGTTLLIAPYDEAEVDAVLGGRDGGGGGPALVGRDIDDALLDEDAEQLVYDLADWDATQVADLDGRLEAEGIAHAFDEDGDLVVLAADEERVDVIVDAVEFPDALEADDDGDGDGLAAVDAVGNLFVAADRLCHDPADTEGVLAAADASRAMASMPVPFGFSPPVWNELNERAGELRRLLESEAELVDDAAVVEVATRLRAALRPYV
ncbi:MAG: hypothetical protein H0W25_15700 [Acidimicrobiia bacterium]|nr:hypothetical protein [Acidimicrobiia bacterium]